MNPFWWLLWGAGAVVLLFVASIAVAAVVDAIRKPNPCERCGVVRGQPEDYRRNLN